MPIDDPPFVRMTTNGITLNVADSGPDDGPLVILVHGFPEFSYGWRRQIGPLAEAGFRVLAPDQRGYNLSEKPSGISAYALDALTDDVIGLIDACGRERASIVGHDWGGVVTWNALLRHPSRFDRAVILNAPHPEVMLRAIRADLGQFRKSWYTLFFQCPWLPEALLRRGDFQWLRRAMTRSSRSGTFSEADFAAYNQAWSEPGALTSMLHWYRAGFRVKHEPYPDPLVKVPTLMIWGAKDLFLGPGLARASFAQCEAARIVWIEDASHWVQHEKPDRVNQLLLEFLQA
jgi:epoxide hydrolase 4